MASFVKEKQASPFVALYQEIFPENNFEKKGKRTMREEMIKFYEELLRQEEKEIEKIDAMVPYSSELEELKKKTETVEKKLEESREQLLHQQFEIEDLEFELIELTSKISKIQQSARKEIEGNNDRDENVKSLKAKIQHVKKLFANR